MTTDTPRVAFVRYAAAMRPTFAHIAATLGLEPHPEGGYYLETYRAAQTLRTPRGERPASTAILFLITADSVSRLHRLAGDELWVFQGGLPLELVAISPAGDLEVRVLGEPDGSAPWLPQALVPAGSWQGARIAGGPHLPAERAWALVSCVVTPGFDFADFELGDRDGLVALCPGQADLIRALT
jgi:predicted cupin superfamily sugar epimerase